MNKYTIFVLFIYVALLSCQRNEIVTLDSSEMFHVRVENVTATKTSMGVGNNILWSENDQIVAFMKTSYGHKYKIKSSFVGKTYADFSRVSSASGDDLSVGMEWDHNVAYYPYSESVECMKSDNGYALDVFLPSEQIYAPKSFGNNSWPMAAVSKDNNITFMNVCGGIKLQFTGNQKVVSIELRGKNEEKLSGAAMVTVNEDTKPVITMADDASTKVILNCGTGVWLEQNAVKEFIIMLPPLIFLKGFTVTVIDGDDNVYKLESDKENVVLRSSLLVMPELKVENTTGGGGLTNDKDYVDEYGINHGKGVLIDGVVWAPVNCGYHASNYKYGKIYQWGRKYGQGYKGDLYNINGKVIQTYSDAMNVSVSAGPVSLSEGQSPDNAHRFYYTGQNYDWCKTPDDHMWNLGTELKPRKSDYDPCPTGWRVPTSLELNGLRMNYSSFLYNNISLKI